ncbi:MAG: peptidoglycan-binding domain-containing protein [Candidatus Paceibacterota bacterium]|jgi:peptidoglycan hydrolase-like protein with peptidoglycan-binding domain
MKKIKISISLLLTSVMFLINIVPAHASVTWTQNDWSGGPGQATWFDITKYDSGSGVSATAPSQLEIVASTDPIDVSRTINLIGGGADNRLSFPHYNNYPDVVSLWNAIPNASEIYYLDEVTGNVVSYTGSFLDPIFDIAPGGEMAVDRSINIRTIGADQDFLMTGQDKPTNSISLYASGPGHTGLNWVSLPYNLSATTASELFNEIPNVAELDVWDTVDYSQRIYDGGFNLDDFPIVPGAAILIKVGVDTTWTPTFNPASVAHTSPATLTSSTYEADKAYVWGPLTYSADTPANTVVSFEVSTDGGTIWQTVRNNTTQTFGFSRTIIYRATLSNTDGFSTPTLTSVSIGGNSKLSSGGYSGVFVSPPVVSPPSSNPISSCLPGDAFSNATGLPCSSFTPNPPSATPTNTTCSILQTLRQGSKGEEVKCLQTKLNSNLIIDGMFGPLTKASVVQYQLSHNLVGDGIVGPLTRGVLNK